MMKISFIATVLNEEKTIGSFLASLANQSKLPDEIIIVDAGSVDKTITKIKKEKLKIKKNKIIIKLLERKGFNRSQGRNEAIKKAKGEIIVTSDAGCLLDKEWLKEITKPFLKEDGPAVVSGFYLPTGESLFQKVLGQLTSVSLKNIDQKNFLPSSRSLAFKKNAWTKVGGYPEELNYCEDLVFDLRLKNAGLEFIFASKAIVFWPQRKNLFQAIRQFFNYSVGDGMAGEQGPHYKKLRRELLSLVGLGILGALGWWQELGIAFFIFFVFKALRLTSDFINGSSFGFNHLLFFLSSLFLIPFLNLAVMLGFLAGIFKKSLIKDKK